MGIAIKVENLSKAYQLGEIGTGTLSRDLERYWAKLRGKEDPFLKIGETNDRTQKGESDVVWSLKDLNFEIEQGDAVGIIGRNGAGKSTLLKILSRVTSPTTGSVKVKGRVASLLEVGTGFHPELTGRENIFLNGAILGMRKAEIKKHFDAIVDFAGIERYIDTPVKRYSSGMYVRLAFAVAAHLESEILVVDEVLAVGDAEFQKKCLGKMNDVSKGEGRTVLFVSHNMASVQALCSEGLFLDNGCSNGIDQLNNSISRYLYGEINLQDNGKYLAISKNAISDLIGQVKIIEVSITDENNQNKGSFKTTEKIIISIEWENICGVPCSPNIQLSIINNGITALIATDGVIDWAGDKKSSRGVYKSTFTLPPNWLNANDYYLSVALDSHSPRLCYEAHNDILKINLIDPMDETSLARGMFTSVRDDVVLWAALECEFDKIS